MSFDPRVFDEAAFDCAAEGLVELDRKLKRRGGGWRDWRRVKRGR